MTRRLFNSSLLFILLWLAAPARAQLNPIQSHGAPTGVCTVPVTDVDTGNFYTCKLGQFVLSSGSAFGTPPASPNGVPQYACETPSGGVAGTGTYCLSGVVGRTNAGATDAIVPGDRSSCVLETNGGAVAVSLPQAGTTNFANNFSFCVKDSGTTISTITPTTSQIAGNNGTLAATLVVPGASTANCYSWDSTNYQCQVVGPAGLNTQIQYNDSGTLNGSANFTFAKGTDASGKGNVTLLGNLLQNGTGQIPGGGEGFQSSVAAPFTDVPTFETDDPALDFIPIGASFGPNNGGLWQRYHSLAIGLSDTTAPCFGSRSHHDDGTTVVNHWTLCDNGSLLNAGAWSGASFGFYAAKQMMVATSTTINVAPPFTGGWTIYGANGPVGTWIDTNTANKAWSMQDLGSSNLIRLFSHNDDGTGIVVQWTLDRSGNEVLTGKDTAAAYATATNCAANGTAANPSVVSCGSAAAGMFSCATNASTGTCQVNTTAVTANSEIQIIQDAADGGASQLNVTCNTALVTPSAKPILLSKSAAASFTINLGTVTTNPGCFEYTITN